MSPMSDAMTILAFDTGPGNAPIDDLGLRHTGKPVDESGALARQGHVNDETHTYMLDPDSFFARKPPKIARPAGFHDRRR